MIHAAPGDRCDRKEGRAGEGRCDSHREAERLVIGDVNR